MTTRRIDGRNASLDTLRALAILMVVFCHATLSFGRSNALDFMSVGGVGVDLFFCLSGWLLGRLLCQEYQQSGTIDVRRFWLRRWMRTLPAYYAVLGMTLAQAMLQHKVPGWWQFTVFLQNYIGMPFFGISWSLCVEEYFYLLVAPLLLIALNRPRFRLALPILLAIPVLSRMSAGWVNTQYGWRWDAQMTHMRYDQCAVGVLLAVLFTFAPKAWAALVRALPVLVPAALVIGGLNFYWRGVHAGYGDWGPLTWSVIFGLLVVLANSNDFWRLRANVPGARYLADRAYAVYLLHVEGIAFMNRILPQAPDGGHGPLWLYVIGVWLLALGAAEVLYRVVERPIMDARNSFAASRSPHHSGRPSPAPPAGGLAVN